MTRRHDPTTAAGIAASLRSLATTLENADPEEAADLLTGVFAQGGVLDEVNEVLSSTHRLILAQRPGDQWDEHQPGYALYHQLADTTEHLYDQTQELRDAPQTLRALPDPDLCATTEQARHALPATPLPPPAVPAAPSPTSPRTTR
ncbi:hypothetical protein V2S66_18925 [Streptomyces sp. V4-01]|uniref:Uncharacterized protein n=1 Tax=Actinacidiphila polyblastidii TaxID=3110430 RepID=A0ABU7PDZ6_9ACTN|nr:hypothetical protein [Streptomyces sp. V4-01]